MPEVNVSVNDLAKAINKLNREQTRELVDLISGKDKELLTRKKDILEKKAQTLSREQTFDV